MEGGLVGGFSWLESSTGWRVHWLEGGLVCEDLLVGGTTWLEGGLVGGFSWLEGVAGWRVRQIGEVRGGLGPGQMGGLVRFVGYQCCLLLQPHIESGISEHKTPTILCISLESDRVVV